MGVSERRFDLYVAVTRKSCKIEPKLLSVTNWKSYMPVWLVPNSMTLNDLEPTNAYFSQFSRLCQLSQLATSNTNLLENIWQFLGPRALGPCAHPAHTIATPLSTILSQVVCEIKHRLQHLTVTSAHNDADKSLWPRAKWLAAIIFASVL